MRQFLLYAVLRLGLWVALWWVLTLVGVGVMLAGVLAALLAMLISILFLNRLRDAAAMRWKAAHERRVERRGAEVDEDAEYEDGLFADDVEVDGERDAPTQHLFQDSSSAGPANLPDLTNQPEEPAEEGLQGHARTDRG